MKNSVELIIEDLTFLKNAAEREKNLISVICYDTAIRVAKLKLPATPQPVTGEGAKPWEAAIDYCNENGITGENELRQNFKSFLAGHSYAAASRPSDAVEFGDLIEDAVNAYFHQAEKELGRKDLGYIEERNWQKIKNDCQRFFTNSKSPNPNK